MIGRRLKILIALIIGLSSGVVNAGDLNVSDMRCQHAHDPYGVETQTPVFSWELNSDVRGAGQSAYQILVSDSEKKLSKDIGNMWDSGKVISDESLGIAYSGNTLESGKRYYWKLRVWDNNDALTGWSDPGFLQMGLLKQSDWEDADWIALEVAEDEEVLLPDSHLPVDKVNPLRKEPYLPQFRKEFTLKSIPVESAVMFISGLGNFVLSLNGKKVGDNFLDPAWSRYDRSSQYVTFDVTDMLRNGSNAIGVRLGNGFLHIPRDKSRYKKLLNTYGFPMMRSKLIVRYKDGTSEVIDSDTSWKACQSPVTFSSIYGGEDFDARLEQEGWDTPGFDDSGWQHALKTENNSTMRSQTSPSLGVRRRFRPVEIYESQKGVYIYDFGQNASGIVELRVKGKAGDRIEMRPGEYLTEDGLSNQNNSGKNYFFSYTLGGGEEETWSPASSYYGFRFVEVHGGVPAGFPNPEGLPVVENLEMLHISNGSENVGTFQCSNQMFNDIFSLIDWSVRSNLSHVMTDCPHREKLGWLEVAHLMSNSIAYNFDIYRMYTGIIDNMKDCIQPNGLVPNTAPEYAEFSSDFRDSPEWGSSAVIVPWFLYKWYGDKSVLEDSYPMMAAYTDYLTMRSEGHLLFHGLGDWYDLGPEHPGYSQLTELGLTPTAIYYYDLKIMEQTAEQLGKKEEAAGYASLAEEVKKAFNDKFFNKEKGYYDKGSQTANAMPLYLGLVEEIDKEGCLRQIVSDIRSRGNSITSGDIGFSYLIRTLMREGESELVYDMNSQSDRPGYGYQLKQGATSLTESWEALQTASHNHCMLGHLMEWLYGSIGGILPNAESVAFKDFIIKTEPAGDITSASVSFRSPYGMIANEWKIEDGVFREKVTVPVGTCAKIYLPASSPDDIYVGGQPIIGQPHISYIGQEKGKCVFVIESGTYDIKVADYP